MRIAFFGGSFDPPHCGHLAIARAAIEHLSLDRVLMAPVGTQPFKQGAAPTGYEHRLAMVRLAVQGEPRIAASTVDGPRPDGSPNYTLQTLRDLRRSLGPEDELFCLVGADSFLALKHWHGADGLLFVCEFIVAGRPGFELDDLGAALPEGVRLSGTARLRSPGCLTIDLESATHQRSRLYLLPDLREDISATEIRAALSNGSGEQRVLPPAVFDYIRAAGLYR